MATAKTAPATMRAMSRVGRTRVIRSLRRAARAGGWRDDAGRVATPRAGPENGHGGPRDYTGRDAHARCAAVKRGAGALA